MAYGHAGRLLGGAVLAPWPGGAAPQRGWPRRRPGSGPQVSGRQDGRMAGLKDRLRNDLTAAMKARDEVRTRTLRMALTSVANAEPLKLRGLLRALNGWQVSGSAFWHSGIPFSVLSTPYSANGNGLVNGSGPQFASVVPGVPLYEHNPIPGITQPGTIQWLNPAAFVSSVDPATGACLGGNTVSNCQFGNLGRNALRGPDFTWSDLYLTKCDPDYSGLWCFFTGGYL